MDASWLSDSFGDILVVALYVLLGMLHLESENFGAGNVTIGMVFSTVSVYNMLKGATSNFCKNCRNIENGIATLKSARDFLDKSSTVPKLKEQLNRRFQLLGLDEEKLSLYIDDSFDQLSTLTCEFRNVEWENGNQIHKFSGQIPLGSFYVLNTKQTKNVQDAWFQLMQGAQQPTSGFLLVPSFARVVGVYGWSLPELFHLSAIENALAFADRRRYNEEDARTVLTSLDVFGKTTFSLKLSDEQMKDGDPLTGAIDPSWVSLEDVALITLIQVIFSDPEILIFDKPLLHLPERLHKRVLAALIMWQRGGPEAVLSVGKSALRRRTKEKSQLLRKGTKGFSASAMETTQKANANAPGNKAQNGEFSDLFQRQDSLDFQKQMKPTEKSMQLTEHGDEYPAWFQKSTCGIKRTLILNLHQSIDVHEIAKEFGGLQELHMEDGNIYVGPESVKELKPVEVKPMEEVKANPETVVYPVNKEVLA
jgi:hypothetical protein